MANACWRSSPFRTRSTRRWLLSGTLGCRHLARGNALRSGNRSLGHSCSSSVRGYTDGTPGRGGIHSEDSVNLQDGSLRGWYSKRHTLSNDKASGHYKVAVCKVAAGQTAVSRLQLHNALHNPSLSTQTDASTFATRSWTFGPGVACLYSRLAIRYIEKLPV